MTLLASDAIDRATGVLLAGACGDALGAGYEFQHSPGPDIDMIGGGPFNWSPGSWTDDTSMANCIARVAARGLRLDGPAGIREVAAGFLEWFSSNPPDVGTTTAAALSGAGGDPSRLAGAAASHFAAGGRGLGNGSLMRTGPVALAHLGDDGAIARAARAISDLTHGDPEAGDSCVLWCIAIDRAVRLRRLDGWHEGLNQLPLERQDLWRERLSEAASLPPKTFVPNGTAPMALQAAIAAIASTPVPPGAGGPFHLQAALEAAVRIGDDTDTVAAIAGALLGGYWGASAVPWRWRCMLHGWPGIRARDLVAWAVLAVQGGHPDSVGWPSADDLSGYYARDWPQDPFTATLTPDPGVVLGNASALASVSACDAFVSLCRLGRGQLRGPEHYEVALADADPPANPNLAFVLADVAGLISRLRDEGRSVYLHCVRTESRTPVVAAAYLMLRFGMEPRAALAEVMSVLPYASPRPALVEGLNQLPEVLARARR